MAHILIVEDNELNRDMLSRRLERRGFEVSIAVDGQEGLDMIKSKRPDLVLMDMDLPIIDGWEATRQCKNNEATKHIPVIALTAHALAEHRQQALRAAATCCLPRLRDVLEFLLDLAAPDQGSPV